MKKEELRGQLASFSRLAYACNQANEEKKIARSKQVLVELDISAMEDYVIIIIINFNTC